jgi:hypothetical protein
VQSLATERRGDGLDDTSGVPEFPEGGELFCDGLFHGQRLLMGDCVIEFQILLHEHYDTAEAVSSFASVVGLSRIVPRFTRSGQVAGLNGRAG